jgi:predicted transcriptional regulator
MNPEEMTDKQTIIDVLSQLPEDATLEQIREEFEIIYGVLDGLREADEGESFSHAEVLEDARRWRQKCAGQNAPVESSTKS